MWLWITIYVHKVVINKMTIKLVFILFNSQDDDDVQEVYHNAEFPEGWDE